MTEMQIGDVVELTVNPTWMRRKVAKLLRLVPAPARAIGRIAYADDKRVVIIAWQEDMPLRPIPPAAKIATRSPVGLYVRRSDIISFTKYAAVS
jgi:hypothetical protein